MNKRIEVIGRVDAELTAAEKGFADADKAWTEADAASRAALDLWNNAKKLAAALRNTNSATPPEAPAAAYVKPLAPPASPPAAAKAASGAGSGASQGGTASSPAARLDGSAAAAAAEAGGGGGGGGGGAARAGSCAAFGLALAVAASSTRESSSAVETTRSTWGRGEGRMDVGGWGVGRVCGVVWVGGEEGLGRGSGSPL